MTSDLVREIEAEAAAERAEVLDWIKVAEEIDEQLKPLEKAREQARDKIKQYLALNADRLDHDEKDEPFLWHPDLDVTYALQGRVTHGYDLVSAAESDPDAVLAASRAGWLKADHTSVEKHPGAGWVDRLKRYHMVISGSTALVKKNAHDRL